MDRRWCSSLVIMEWSAIYFVVVKEVPEGMGQRYGQRLHVLINTKVKFIGEFRSHFL